VSVSPSSPTKKAVAILLATPIVSKPSPKRTPRKTAQAAIDPEHCHFLQRRSYSKALELVSLYRFSASASALLTTPTLWPCVSA
jgi:hypothetical protein